MFAAPAAVDAAATMRLHLRHAVLAAALIVPAATLAACGQADTAAPAAKTAGASAPAAQPTLASWLQKVVDAGSPGVIALVNDGHTTRGHAAGVANTRSGRALRPTDRFRAGSMTKSFVATVALQLVGEGRLSLSDTVEHWLPGILPYGDHVTVRQLLGLTSGIPDHMGAVEAEWVKGNMTRLWSPRELVALVAGEKPDFAPGSAWAYSNTNYVLAGLIVERVTGHRLGDELARRVFEPLHLRHTSFPVDASVIAGRHASGYALVDGERRDVTVLDTSGAWAAGNLVSTATDIERFWRALLGGKLLAPAELAAMKTTVPSFEGTPYRYGLGIQELPSECGTLWGNGGDIAGYANAFENTEDGKHQAGVIVNENPAPEAVGETRGSALRQAMADALGSSTPC